MGFPWPGQGCRNLGFVPRGACCVRCSFPRRSVCRVCNAICPDIHSSVHDSSSRVSTLSPSNWRTQRVVVHSISRPTILSTASMNTGLTTSPTRGFPSQYIPRSSSITFHPTEMLYGVGSPDGTGAYLMLGSGESNLLRKPLQCVFLALSCCESKPTNHRESMRPSWHHVISLLLYHFPST